MVWLSGDVIGIATTCCLAGRYEVESGAEEGTRTLTPISRQRILSPRRLPFRHLGMNLDSEIVGAAYLRGKHRENDLLSISLRDYMNSVLPAFVPSRANKESQSIQ